MNRAAIWHCPDGRLIDVDCGAVFTEAGGRLGCLCLETGKEYMRLQLMTRLYDIEQDR